MRRPHTPTRVAATREIPGSNEDPAQPKKKKNTHLKSLENIKLGPNPAQRPIEAEHLLAHWVGSDGLSTYGLSGSPPTACVRTRTKYLSARDRLPNGNQPRHLLCTWPPQHMRQAIYILSFRHLPPSVSGPRPRDPSPGQVCQSRHPTTSPQRPPGPRPSPCSAVVPSLPHTAVPPSKVKGLGAPPSPI